MSKLLVVGDPHLGAGLSLGRQGVGSSLNSRIVDQSNLLDWILLRAMEENVTDIIITGDVFEDPKPPIAVIQMLVEWLQKCISHNIAIHIIAGNHDVFRSGQFYTSPLDLISALDIDKIAIYNRINTVHLDDVSITFLPFRDRKALEADTNSTALRIIEAQLPYELSSIKLDSKKVLIGHLALEGSIPIGYEIDDMQNEILCPLTMFGGYDHVIMGHVHKHQIMQARPHISHIGSMDISNFGEMDQEKFIAILDPKRDTEFRFIKLPTRKLKQLIIDIPEKVEPMEFIESFLSKEGELGNSISRVSLKLSSSQSTLIDRKKIEDILRKKGVFHLSKLSEEKKSEQIQKENAPKFDSTVNEESAIRMYAQSIENEQDREDFIRVTLSIVREVRGA